MSRSRAESIVLLAEELECGKMSGRIECGGVHDIIVRPQGQPGVSDLSVTALKGTVLKLKGLHSL